MTTTAAIGHGTKFQRSDDGTSSGIFADVAEVMSITAPNVTRETVDSTHMGSPEGWREFISSLKDGGEVSIESNFDPNGTDTANWLADINSDAAGYYKIVFPDATEWAFSAFMTELSPSVPLDDKMTASANYKITGKPAFIA